MLKRICGPSSSQLYFPNHWTIWVSLKSGDPFPISTDHLNQTEAGMIWSSLMAWETPISGHVRFQTQSLEQLLKGTLHEGLETQTSPSKRNATHCLSKTGRVVCNYQFFSAINQYWIVFLIFLVSILVLVWGAEFYWRASIDYCSERNINVVPRNCWDTSRHEHRLWIARGALKWGCE